LELFLSENSNEQISNIFMQKVPELTVKTDHDDEEGNSPNRGKVTQLRSIWSKFS